MSNDYRKVLNVKAGRLIKSLGISINVTEDQYDILRGMGYGGYAHYYLNKCWNDFEWLNTADVTVYKQLLDIDTKLGTSQSCQLTMCVLNTYRLDLFKVENNF